VYYLKNILLLLLYVNNAYTNGRFFMRFFVYSIPQAVNAARKKCSFLRSPLSDILCNNLYCFPLFLAVKMAARQGSPRGKEGVYPL
jgi:hypothetical protein